MGKSCRQVGEVFVMSERLQQELPKRLPQLDPKDHAAINAFAEEYDAKVRVTDFKGDNLYFTDNSERSVIVVNASQHGTDLHLPICRSDIVVVTVGADRLMLGWIQTKNLLDAQDRMIVDIQSLYTMPEEFDFAQPCPHAQTHGAWMDETTEKWVCFNCSAKLVIA